jgi:hypothetical protein
MFTIGSLTDLDLEAVGIVDVTHRAMIMEAVRDLSQQQGGGGGSGITGLGPKPPTKPLLTNLVEASKQTNFASLRLGKCLAKNSFAYLYVAEWQKKPVSVRSIRVRDDIEVLATKLNTIWYTSPLLSSTFLFFPLYRLSSWIFRF